MKITESLKNAFAAAIVEIIDTETKENLTDFLEILKRLRFELSISHLNEKVIEQEIWSGLRSNQNTLSCVMNYSTRFLLELNIAEEVDFYLGRLVYAILSYEQESNIVDSEMKEKTPAFRDTMRVLRHNLWLFCLIYASLHLSTVQKLFTDKLGSG